MASYDAVRVSSRPYFQGPTISPIYTPSSDGSPSKEGSFYAVSIGVPKARIYETVKQLRKEGGSGVLVFPLTYVFDEVGAGENVLKLPATPL
jgi:hypothetical protein